MTDFIMIQVRKIFNELLEKETITKEDIEALNKRLDSFDEQAKEYNVELTDAQKSEIKTKKEMLLARLGAEVKPEIISEIGTNVETIESVEEITPVYEDNIDDEILDESDVEFIEEPTIMVVEPTVEEVESLEEKVTPENVTVLAPISKFKNTELEEYDEEQKEENKKSNRLLTAGCVAVGIGIIVTAIALAKANKKDINETPVQIVETIPTTVDEDITVIESTVTLPDYLAFDVNNNSVLVENMTQFIVDIMSKGVAVKDVMTEDAIAQAEKCGVNFLTIEQLMDYYFVMNIENIDPVDYARLNYTSKTTDTILNNYLACANVFMDDLLTAKENTTIDFTKIIADKESAASVQKMADLIAKYNSAENKEEVKTEISEYIEENYVEKYTDIYSVSANEQAYRFMFTFDELTNGKGIPSDINIILNEDRTYSCSNTKTEDKNKTERAQEYTDIKNIIDDKLAIARDNYNQDMTNISEVEQRTGIMLENEIEEYAISLNAKYIANPEFKTEPVKTTSTVKTDGKASNVKGDNGLPIASSEFEKYNIDPNSINAKEKYEEAVENEFEQIAQNDPSHTITTDTDGNILVKGEEVDTQDFNVGGVDGYLDGNSGNSYSPKKSSKSYKAGYSKGYAEGKEDRKQLDEKYNSKNETHYEDVKDVVVDEYVSNDTYENYTPESTYTEEPSYVEEEPIIEITNTFVPIEEETEEIITEEEFIDYTSASAKSTINELKLLSNLLKQTKNNYDSILVEEKTKTMC